MAGIALLFLRRRRRARGASAAAVEEIPAMQDRRRGYEETQHTDRLVQELPQSKNDLPPGLEAEGSLAVYEASEDTRPHELG